MGIQITPSILNADFGNLAAEVGRIPSADMVHVDVMDNHFVPNLTLGPAMVEALSRATEQPLDIHLMIDDPDRWAPAYASCAPRAPGPGWRSSRPRRSSRTRTCSASSTCCS